MKNKKKISEIRNKILKRASIKKFLIVYMIVFDVLCLGFSVNATGTTDGIPNDQQDTITDLENDVPFTLGVTVDTSNDEGTLAGTLQMLLVITVISLAP